MQEADEGSVPGPGGKGNLLQHPGLQKVMDRGAWGSTVQGVAKSQIRLKGLSTYTRSLDQSI